MNIQQFSKNPLALAVALTFADCPLVNATPGDVVSDFLRVNRTTEGLQQNADVAMSAGGNAVVVWESENQDGDGFGILAQRYRPGGIRVGPEFQVNSTTAGDQKNPAVTMDADGDFVVAFESPDDDHTGIRVRRFDRYGNPRGDDFQVNSETLDYQFDPALDSSAFGEFIIAWESADLGPTVFPRNSIHVKRYSRNGEELSIGGQPEIAEYQIDNVSSPDVAMDADGDYVITWVANEELRKVEDIYYFGLFAFVRAFDRENKPISDPIRLFSDRSMLPAPTPEPYYVHFDRHPKVEMDADGDFLVVVEKSSGAAYANTLTGAWFDKSGNRKQDINDLIGLRYTNHLSSAAMDADGDFVVSSEGQDCYYLERCDSFSVVSVFDKSGQLIKRVSERIDPYNPNPLFSSSVAMDADGDAIETRYYYQIRFTTPPPNDYDIFTRRLRGFEKIDLKLKQKDRTDPVPPGGLIDYRLQVKNRHPKLHPTGYKSIDRAIGVASGVRLTDWIPKGAVLLSAKGDGWRCRIDGNHPQCNLNHGLWPGDHTMLNLKVRAPKSGEKAINHARVHADQDDPNRNNNRARERTFLKPN